MNPGPTELLVATLIQLTGPDGQYLIINPTQVVTIREPRDEVGFPKDVRCLIHTTDGKFVTVRETCDIVRKMLEEK